MMVKRNISKEKMWLIEIFRVSHVCHRAFCLYALSICAHRHARASCAHIRSHAHIHGRHHRHLAHCARLYGCRVFSVLFCSIRRSSCVPQWCASANPCWSVRFQRFAFQLSTVGSHLPKFPSVFGCVHARTHTHVRAHRCYTSCRWHLCRRQTACSLATHGFSFILFHEHVMQIPYASCAHTHAHLDRLRPIRVWLLSIRLDSCRDYRPFWHMHMCKHKHITKIKTKTTICYYALR